MTKAGRVARVLACVLLAAAARQAPAQRGGHPPRRYTNPEYLFSVPLPQGVQVVTGRPPTPNHGVGLQVATDAKAWAWAEYETLDAETLPAEVESMRGIWAGNGCAVTGQRNGRLGGRAAVEVTFRCGPRGGRGQPDVMKLLLTMHTPPERGLVVYQVGVQYKQGSPAAARAERLYRELSAGFTFTTER
ncbi:MAG TPA: hypothetical protein VFJ82_25590 [Longimicrobium sp.]|nr:hypothetical protein [Longimicrobium sp.]